MPTRRRKTDDNPEFDAPSGGSTRVGTTAPAGAAPGSTARAGGTPAATPGGVSGTRIGGLWVAVVVAALLLIFLLIFILQNEQRVTIHYLGADGHLPLAVALLFAAVVGALIVAIAGTARILQLRHVARRRAKATKKK